MATVSTAPPSALRGGPADDTPARPQCASAAGSGDRDDEEEGNNNDTQESFTQQILTQTQADLTQLGCDDGGYDDPFASQCTQGGGIGGQTPVPVDPLSVPWGRLMPVGGNNDGNCASQSGGSGTRLAAEMLPQPPERGKDGGDGGGEENDSDGRSRTPPPNEGVSFLGLRGLRPGDRFNEYSIGRSAKADVTAQKLVDDSGTGGGKQKRHDFIHAMVSNRHCRIYCLLNSTSGDRGGKGGGGSAGGDEMEVFAEDTSGNGTLINGTTLLRRNERRRLHTGDVICLLNPKLLERKLRSPADRKAYVGQYSYVFVNLYEQEARHGWDDAGGLAGGIAASASGGYSSSNRAGSGRPRLLSVGRHGPGSNRGPNSGSGSRSSFGSAGRGGLGLLDGTNSNSRGAWRSSGGGGGKPRSSSSGRRTPAAVNVRAMRCHSAAGGGGRRSTSGQRGPAGGGEGRGEEEPTDKKPSGDGARRTDLVCRPPPPRDRFPHPAAARGGGAAAVGSGSSSLGSFLKSSAGRRVEDEYDLRDLLGKGTCGEVRRAIHRRSGEERAVKVIAIGGRQNSKIYR